MWRRLSAATLAGVESAGRIEGAGARADRPPSWEHEPVEVREFFAEPVRDRAGDLKKFCSGRDRVHAVGPAW